MMRYYLLAYLKYIIKPKILFKSNFDQIWIPLHYKSASSARRLYNVPEFKDCLQSHPNKRLSGSNIWETIISSGLFLFGLSSSPGFFCKILALVIEHFHIQGIQVVFYSDDGLMIHQSPVMFEHHTDRVCKLLNQLGWIEQSLFCHKIWLRQMTDLTF